MLETCKPPTRESNIEYIIRESPYFSSLDKEEALEELNARNDEFITTLAGGLYKDEVERILNGWIPQ